MEQVVRGTLSDGGRGIDKLGSGVGLEWGWVPSEVPVGSRFEVPRRAQKAAGAAWFLSVRRGRVAFPQVRCSPLKDWRRFRIDAMRMYCISGLVLQGRHQALLETHVPERARSAWLDQYPLVLC